MDGYIGKYFPAVLCLAAVLLLTAALTGCQQTPAGTINVDLQQTATGLTAPVVLTSPNDGSGRLFIADQIGLVRVILPGGTMQEQPFLDIIGRIVPLNPQYDERGLLGLAFHPDFRNNGRFFVYYSAPLRQGAPSGWNHTSVISEFRVSATNMNMANPASERIIMQVDQPQANHNGGQLAFGPDGFLYISLGDGGGANDVGPGHPATGNGQDTTTLLGSILRIDVNQGTPYGIPPDNPFVGNTAAGRPEIYAWGFRNPYRISFDAGGTNQLFVGDVGQNLWEEVSIVTRGGNYGWRIKEGTHCFDPNNPNNPPATCPDRGPRGEPLIDPIIEHGHNQGIAIIGGYVYRGRDIRLQADDRLYVFGNWTATPSTPDGRVYVAMPPASGSGLWTFRPINFPRLSQNGRLGRYLLAFGQGPNNDLYLLTTMNTGPTGRTGTVFRMVPSGGDIPVPQATVEMRNSQFQPRQITVRRGTAVTWINRDSRVHTVTSGTEGSPTGMFDATVNSGQTFRFVFNQTGTFPYHCRIHSGMSGTVTVTE